LRGLPVTDEIGGKCVGFLRVGEVAVAPGNRLAIGLRLLRRRRDFSIGAGDSPAGSPG